MKGISNKTQLLINLIASFITLGINVCINLLVMPVIVNAVGAEAYGFVTLANNVINYATIITIALNSVSSRFIAIAFHKKQLEEANRYFNSVLIADAILCIGFLIGGSVFILNIENILNVPLYLLTQVKHLFFWLLLNFIVSVISTIFTVGTFVTDKLYLSSLANSLGSITKAGVLLYLFGNYTINIAYVGFASLIYSLIILIANAIYARKLVPSLTVKFKYCSFNKVKEMLSSGIWSSITQLSNTLSDGLDTLLTNLYLTGAELGALSVAYTVPMLFSSLLSAICTLFNPKLTEYYARDNTELVVNKLKQNMKMTGTFSSIMFCGVIVFGENFFSLMVPGQNIHLIYQLACLSSLSLVASGITSGLNNVFVLTNKLKVNSIVWLMVSFFDVIMVLAFLKNTALGVYAVAGVSKISSILINLIYLPIYASKCLNINKKTFYPIILKYSLDTFICFGAFILLKHFIVTTNTWLSFICLILCAAIIGFIINFFLFLNREERKEIILPINKMFRG